MVQAQMLQVTEVLHYCLEDEEDRRFRGQQQENLSKDAQQLFEDDAGLIKV
jgi:hypothetical protein